jgi:hypothetical protein
MTFSTRIARVSVHAAAERDFGESFNEPLLLRRASVSPSISAVDECVASITAIPPIVHLSLNDRRHRVVMAWLASLTAQRTLSSNSPRALAANLVKSLRKGQGRVEVVEAHGAGERVLERFRCKALLLLLHL